MDQVKEAEKIDFVQERISAEREHQQTLKIAIANGFVVDTAEWLTIKRYADKYGVSTHVVTNWIRRGTIPADCTLVLPELNDIRLVKDQPYGKQ